MNLEKRKDKHSRMASKFQVPHYCPTCRFYESIPQKGGWRQLCHFTGRVNPRFGQTGCYYLRGKWEADNVNIGVKPEERLTENESAYTVDFPNLVRPCAGLSTPPGEETIGAQIADSTHAGDGMRLEHIGKAQRPHARETAAASLRPGSVGALPFCFNNPELSEV